MDGEMVAGLWVGAGRIADILARSSKLLSFELFAGGVDVGGEVECSGLLAGACVGAGGAGGGVGTAGTEGEGATGAVELGLLVQASSSN